MDRSAYIWVEKKIKMKIAFVFLILSFALVGRAQTITYKLAQKNVGNSATVCGTVTSSQYTSQIEKHPTFICFGNLFPNQNFSIVIFEEDLGKFAYNPVDLKERDICVMGKIEKYQGKPVIFVTEPSQIEYNDSTK
jgi:hypothetical protein